MRLSDKDEGKHVVNKAGKKIGMVSRVEGNHAYVDPDPGITDTIKSKLGWGDSDEETYSLDDDHVESINDDEVRLQRL